MACLHRIRFAILTAVVAAVAAGCASAPNGGTPAKEDSGRHGIEVAVHEDGSLFFYGNPIKKEQLVVRLLDEGAGRGRAVLVRAHGKIEKNELEQMRDYLVRNRIYNVTIVTSRSAAAYNNIDKLPETEKYSLGQNSGSSNRSEISGSRNKSVRRIYSQRTAKQPETR